MTLEIIPIPHKDKRPIYLAINGDIMKFHIRKKSIIIRSMDLVTNQARFNIRNLVSAYYKKRVMRQFAEYIAEISTQLLKAYQYYRGYQDIEAMNTYEHTSTYIMRMNEYENLQKRVRSICTELKEIYDNLHIHDLTKTFSQLAIDYNRRFAVTPAETIIIPFWEEYNRNGYTIPIRTLVKDFVFNYIRT